MKIIHRKFSTPATILAVTLHGQAIAQSARFDDTLTYPPGGSADGRPTQATAQTLRDELLFQRATQTYLWAMPLINTLGMQGGVGKRHRRRLQRVADLEETARCQDDHDRRQLRGPGQGRSATMEC